MLEPFLINPPRRLRKNPLGVDELVVLNPPRRKPRAKKRRAKVAIRRKRNSKGRFVKAGRAVAKRRRRSTKRRTVNVVKRALRRGRSKRRVRSLKRHSVYVTNPPRRRGRRYRRNPGGLGFSMGSIVPTLKEGAFIALGAIAVGHAMARIPYINTLTGPTRHLARIGVAILGGKLISKFLKQPALGRAFAMGGVVATALQVASENFPALVPLSSTDEMALGMYYASPQLSEYYSAGPNVSGQPDGLNFEQDMPERLTQSRF
jgi:hypothetical protein